MSLFLSYRASFKIDRHDSKLESLVKLGINASSLWQENTLLESQEEDGIRESEKLLHLRPSRRQRIRDT